MAPLSIDGAISSLADASRKIQRRNGVKIPEAKRIEEAVDLLRSREPTDAKGAKRRRIYLEFLQKVLQVNGASMVILCVVGLGLSVISIAKEDVRLNLPYVMKDVAGLDNSVLHRLANQYFNSDDSASHPQIETGSQAALMGSPEYHEQNPQETHQADPSARTEQLSIQQTDRQIDYRCSAARVSEMPQIGDLLFVAVQNSNQWIWERVVGGTARKTTDCLNVLVPENRNQDITITLLVGHEKGLEVIERLKLASM
ncbi:hypothetical protein I7I51_00924 [Histoplasma capsulatum]|uniref:Uncharacterized protein n=1 Tax=Ajellomyces capsulatus TaxID=5037 RepID=A0A8A1MGY4_AJECA|nr:predicted protein [Histoplasma mississippiense (nom. inval.)]EDN10991.1 predicted protein [Histoplasma mississippiense (nom. inval.)]QSS63864.1 hypothetical protein I7I51_00924 [Histoplasma capsulatum]